MLGAAVDIHLAPSHIAFDTRGAVIERMARSAERAWRYGKTLLHSSFQVGEA